VNVAFIGGGNMARAMLGGMGASGLQTDAVQVLEPDADKRVELAREFGVTAQEAPGEWLYDAAVVVLAVKPQQMAEAVAAVRDWLGPALVLSIAAGVRATTLSRWLGHDRIVRAMPNTPALIRAGITAAVARPGVTVEQHAAADLILRSVGDVLWLDDESLLDPVTAVSGSGPGYVFYFIEALQQAALELGFPPEQARQLAVQTFAGAAQLASQSTESIATLRERVTSKGGTTAAALAKFDAAAVRQAIVAGAHAASTRATEMGDELDAGGDLPQSRLG
jgi:pyrroline-5-carboxylate reductase